MRQSRRHIVCCTTPKEPNVRLITFFFFGMQFDGAVLCFMESIIHEKETRSIYLLLKCKLARIDFISPFSRMKSNKKAAESMSF